MRPVIDLLNNSHYCEADSLSRIKDYQKYI